jgi:hypothetical protein
MKNELSKPLKKESRLPEAFAYSGSVIDPKESPSEISDKISKMMPDMGVIRDTGIIRNTDSFKESKQILDNFRSALQNSQTGTFNERKPNNSCEELDDRPALEKAIDRLQMVVQNMIKAGIEVPPIYKDFLHATRPYEPPPELEVVSQPPLFKITGLDEKGEVIVKTDTPIVLKKGKTEIALTHEKLTDTVVNSQKIDCNSFRELHDWVKQNVHRAGSMEKISDDEWSKLRQTIVETYKKYIDSDVGDVINKEVKPKEEPTVKIEVPKSINLNAYEIRLQVLKESLDWVKYRTPVTQTGNTEEVLEIANKFYKFVENRK